jgi:hypothetical protein
MNFAVQALLVLLTACVSKEGRHPALTNNQNMRP